MNIERDKFLTEAMDECWHEMKYNELGDRFSKLYRCTKCHHQDNSITYDNNFSTWEGFGKLWEWANQQKWFWQGVFHRLDHQVPELFINPDRFADAVYAFLKERKL